MLEMGKCKINFIMEYYNKADFNMQVKAHDHGLNRMCLTDKHIITV
jgi:hypothetical protein